MTEGLLRQSFDETDFLVVDVETTGVSTDYGDRVIELGAVKLRGGTILETFGTLVDPERPIATGAYRINRISPQMVMEAPTFRMVAPRLLRMAQDSVFAGYNAPFDHTFVNSELRAAGFPQLPSPIIDVLVLARQVLPGLGRYPQDLVAAAMGVPFPFQHRALQDALATARLFSRFLSILKAYDFGFVEDLLRHDLGHEIDRKRMGAVENAMTQGNNLWIRYLSPYESELSERVVTPRQLISTDGLQERNEDTATHLLAFCHLTHSERSFRIDRILDIKTVT